MSVSLEDLRLMAVFAAVVEERSFTGAATRLGLSKSAVSTRISLLERRQGVRLLHRTTRRMEVTVEGLRLYEGCARMLSAAADASELLSDVGREPQGLLRVTTPVGFGMLQLVDLLPEFLRRHPAVRVEVSLSERPVDLIAERFDVAVRFSSRLKDSALVARRVAVDHHVLCAAPSYLSRRGTPATPEELVEHECLRFSHAAPEWTFYGPQGEVSVPIAGSLIADNVALLRSALLSGMGLAAMPASFVHGDLLAGRLIALLPEHQMDKMGVYVIHAHSRHAPARVRAFVEFLAERLRDAPWHQEGDPMPV